MALTDCTRLAQVLRELKPSGMLATPGRLRPGRLPETARCADPRPGRAAQAAHRGIGHPLRPGRDQQDPTGYVAQGLGDIAVRGGAETRFAETSRVLAHLAGGRRRHRGRARRDLLPAAAKGRAPRRAPGPGAVRDRLHLRCEVPQTSEVCGMHVEDLDLRLDDEHAHVHGKGGTVRTVLLDDRSYVALLKLYLARSGYTSGPLFRASINGRGGPLSCDAAHSRWKKYCAAAGAGIGIHQLRHAHATELSTAASPSRSYAAAWATRPPRPPRPTPCSPTRSPTPRSAPPAASARPRAGEPGMARGSLGSQPASYGKPSQCASARYPW